MLSRAQRQAPSNCQNEPPYPHDATVVFALSAPDMTCHMASDRCSLDYPHYILDCKEFDGMTDPIASQRKAEELAKKPGLWALLKKILRAK